MKFNLETITTSLFGFFVVMGSLIGIIRKNKDSIPFLNNMKKERRSLSNHFIFNELQSWQDYQIDAKCSQVSCPVRSALAKKFLHLRFELREEYYRELVAHVEKNPLTFQYLADLKYSKEQEFTKKAIEIGIPEIVLEKFHICTGPAEIADLYLYERILQYKHFDSDSAKLSAVFCVDLKDLYLSGQNAVSVIMGLNGQIDIALGLKKKEC